MFTENLTMIISATNIQRQNYDSAIIMNMLWRHDLRVPLHV